MEKLINEVVLIGSVLFLGNRKYMIVKRLPNVLSPCYPFVIHCLAPELKAESWKAIGISEFPSCLREWKGRERLHVIVALQTLRLA